MTLRVEAACPGLLVLPDTYFPGWRATVNGRKRTIYATDGAFRGVTVPKGTSRVEFRYEPRAFPIGIALAVAGLAAFAHRLVSGCARGDCAGRDRRQASASAPNRRLADVNAAPDVRGTGTWPKPLPESRMTSSGSATHSWRAGSSTCRRAAGSSSASTMATPHVPATNAQRTLEIGAGLGAHLEFEDIEQQEYYARASYGKNSRRI